MLSDLIIGVSLPFAGTVIGSSSVLLSKNGLNMSVQRVLSGFAAGVMVAASVWSLLIPAMDYSSDLGAISFFPAVMGFWLGVFCLMFTERMVTRLNLFGISKRNEKAKSTLIMVLAVALHNFPEGMAVGVAYAGLLCGEESITAAGALALSIGVAVQNLPEGAVVSLPLRNGGRFKAFGCGVLSGIIEPVGAVLTIALSRVFIPVLPYFLGFAAGAMMFVVVSELVPETSSDSHSDKGTVFFSLGFSLMMALDVAFG